MCVLSVLPSSLAIRIRDGQSSALELSTVGGTGYLRTQRDVQQLASEATTAGDCSHHSIESWLGPSLTSPKDCFPGIHASRSYLW